MKIWVSLKLSSADSIFLIDALSLFLGTKKDHKMKNIQIKLLK